MKTLSLLSALLIGAGLSFAGPDGKCKKGECKKSDGASAAVASPAFIPVVLDDDEAKPEKPQRRERGEKPERGAKPDGRRGPGAMLERLKAKDTDGNGSISLAEFKTDIPEDRVERASKFFTMLDKDADGSISAEELKTPPARRGPPGGERGGAEGERRGPPGGARGGKPGGEGGGERPERPPLAD